MDSDSDESCISRDISVIAECTPTNPCSYIAQYLPPGTSYLEYSFDSRRHYIARIFSAGTEELSWEVGSQEDVDEQILKFARLMSRSLVSKSRYEAAGSLLAQGLLAPLLERRDLLERSYLYVLPCGKLHMMSLADLPGWLDDCPPTSYLHSAQELWSMSHGLYHVRSSRQPPAFVVSASSSEGMCPLPGSIEEGHAVTRILDSVLEREEDPTAFVYGENATCSAVLRTKSPFVFHFSGHAGSMKKDGVAFRQLAFLLRELHVTKTRFSDAWLVAAKDHIAVEGEGGFEMVHPWIILDELSMDEVWKSRVMSVLQSFQINSTLLEVLNSLEASEVDSNLSIVGEEICRSQSHPQDQDINNIPQDPSLDNALAKIDAACTFYDRLDNSMSKRGLFLFDGQVTCQEISTVAVQNTSHVTISACQAMNTPEDGEAISGLGRAFLNAGAKSVLFNLYPVRDESTVPFIQMFYRLLVEGFGRADALHAAQKEFRFRPPIFGSSKGWVLYGATGPIFERSHPRPEPSLESPTCMESMVNAILFNLQDMRLRWRILKRLCHYIFSDEGLYVEEKIQELVVRRMSNDLNKLLLHSHHCENLEQIDQAILELTRSRSRKQETEIEENFCPSHKAPTTLFSAPAYPMPRQCIPQDMELVLPAGKVLKVQEVGRKMQVLCSSFDHHGTDSVEVIDVFKPNRIERQFACFTFKCAAKDAKVYFTIEHPIICILDGALQSLPARDVQNGTYVLTKGGLREVKVRIETHHWDVYEYHLDDPHMLLFAGCDGVHVATFGCLDALAVKNTFLDTITLPSRRRSRSAPARLILVSSFEDALSESTGTSVASPSTASGSTRIVIGPSNSSTCSISQLRQLPIDSGGRKSSFGSGSHQDSACIACTYERKAGDCRFGVFCDHCHACPRKRSRRGHGPRKPK